MPITLNCGCGKRLQVRDELAGKKARCPGCGTILPIPSQSIQAPPILEGQLLSSENESELEPQPVSKGKRAASRPKAEDDYEGVRVSKRARPSIDEGSDEPPDLDDEPRRRRKKKKKRSKSVLFTPLLTLFGIDMTPLKLIIFFALIISAGVFAFLYFSAPDARVRVVDVYGVDNDLDEFMLDATQIEDVVMKFMFHKEIPRRFVVRDSKEGAFLLVQFKISERALKKIVGEKYENTLLSKKDVILEGDGETVNPLYLYQADVGIKKVEIKPKKRKGEEEEPEDRRKPDPDGPPKEAHKKDVSPSEDNPWTHKGELQIDPTGGKSTFQGVRGMRVTYEHGPLPTNQILITWDDKSEFWYGVKKEEVPSDLFLYAWRVTCLFPKPASTKNLKLTFLGKRLTMDYP
jgi:hypothetical protein